MRAAVANARDRPQLLAGSNRDPHLFAYRRARLGYPVHQEVSLFERRKQLLIEPWRQQEASQHDDTDAEICRGRPADVRRKSSLIAALQEAYDGRLAPPFQR